jgi:DNA-directed RNA polymerase I subunit RPA2
VIINPHAFPSRMTVGMILEMMAGKIGAVQGRWMDNSAWSLVDEKPLAADRLRVGLVDCGFEPHGREQLYCGATGVAMEAEVFIGIGGYQRLRHMVLDKWQARARTDHGHRAVTRTGQPVKGRKRHGGVRVGEMERDALLSHGIAEVVVDRLMNVSDLTRAFVCMTCGGFAGVYEKAVNDVSTVKHCRFCEQHGTSVGMASHEDGAGGVSSALVAAGAADNVRLIHIPQVLRLWASELTSVGVRVAFRFSDEPTGIRSSR